MSVWKPASFSSFHKSLKDDPEGSSNELDFTLQTLASQSQNALNTLETKQPIQGGITKNRPTGPALYTQYWDTSLNKVIYYMGNGKWRDAAGILV